MIQVTVITVGTLKEGYWRDAMAEYEKRLQGYCKFQLLELPEVRLPEDPSPAEISAGLEKEADLMRILGVSFHHSARLNKHIRFLYDKGSMYKACNGNLLYHGCVPMTDDGGFATVYMFGEQLSGKTYFDVAEEVARHAFFGQSKNIKGLDFMWYLWCGRRSPLCGRNIKTFERTFISDKSAWHEEQNPYYRLYHERATCENILAEFGLNSP